MLLEIDWTGLLRIKLNITPNIIKGPQQITAQHKEANIKAYFGVYVFVCIMIISCV